MTKKRLIAELERRYGVDTVRRWLTVIANPESEGNIVADDIDRLANLLDVLISNPQDGDLLQYDATTSKWLNKVANGGSQPLVSVSLVKAVADVPEPGTLELAWDQMYDNLWMENALDAIPAGLGMTFAFDGSSANITTTEHGFWSISLWARANSVDNQWQGDTQIPFVDFSAGFDFKETQWGNLLSSPFEMPAGISDQFLLSTNQDAEADPFPMTMFAIIMRLG